MRTDEQGHRVLTAREGGGVGVLECGSVGLSFTRKHDGWALRIPKAERRPNSEFRRPSRSLCLWCVAKMAISTRTPFSSSGKSSRHRDFGFLSDFGFRISWCAASIVSGKDESVGAAGAGGAAFRITPLLQHSTPPHPSVSRLQLHHIVGRGFALAGGADADEAGLFAQLREVGSTEVAHAGLYPADQLRQDAV
jgi:hypothetical protein